MVAWSCPSGSSGPARVTPRRSRLLTRPCDPSRPWRESTVLSIPRAPSGSTGAPRPAIRDAGVSTATLHDYTDRDEKFGFQEVNYEVIQHFPILREAWVISLRGAAQTAYTKSDQQIPFFMLPSVGGGSSLRGFSSWRFRDLNSLVVQAEWRIMVNRYLDTAVFYDAGKVTSRRADLNLDGLKSDYGFGLRFHGPFATPLRVELARSKEGLSVVFSSSAVF